MNYLDKLEKLFNSEIKCLDIRSYEFRRKVGEVIQGEVKNLQNATGKTYVGTLEICQEAADKFTLKFGDKYSRDWFNLSYFLTRMNDKDCRKALTLGYCTTDIIDVCRCSSNTAQNIKAMLAGTYKSRNARYNKRYIAERQTARLHDVQKNEQDASLPVLDHTQDQDKVVDTFAAFMSRAIRSGIWTWAELEHCWKEAERRAGRK